MFQLTNIEIATLVVFLILQVADVWTTTKALRMGATEANPVIAWVMNRTGRAWPLVKLTLAFGGGYLMWSEGLLWAIWTLCAVYAIVVISNWLAIQDLKDRSR